MNGVTDIIAPTSDSNHTAVRVNTDLNIIEWVTRQVGAGSNFRWNGVSEPDGRTPLAISVTYRAVPADVANVRR